MTFGRFDEHIDHYPDDFSAGFPDASSCIVPLFSAKECMWIVFYLLIAFLVHDLLKRLVNSMAQSKDRRMDPKQPLADNKNHPIGIKKVRFEYEARLCELDIERREKTLQGVSIPKLDAPLHFY